MALHLSFAVSHSASIALATMLVVAGAGNAPAQTRATPFVAPLRTIADITAILDQEKQDPKLAVKLKAAADAKPPAGLSRHALANFYFDRAHARADLGRNRDAIIDAQKALELGTGEFDEGELARSRNILAMQYFREGEPLKALPVLQQTVRENERQLVLPGSPGRGWLFDAYNKISQIYLLTGDMPQAEAYVQRSRRRLAEARNWPSYPTYRPDWHSTHEVTTARLHEARGEFREAEAAYHRAEVLKREWAVKRVGISKLAPQTQIEDGIDYLIAYQGRMKAHQGRIAEGEADIRRALLSRLKAIGKYNTRTANLILMLANTLTDQGRYAEAEKLARVALEIDRGLGVAEDAQTMANVLSRLASILNLQGRWPEASDTYGALEVATKDWEPARREGLTLDVGHIATLYNSNNLAAGMAAAERLLAWQKARFGEQHLETAGARGMLAVGYARAGRDAEALREFNLAIPVLLAASRKSDVDDTVGSAAREQRAQIIIEAYMALLARTRRGGEADTAALETFRLAEAIRGRSVQKALAASSTRMRFGDPALAVLARTEQDLEKQLNAELALLNSVLSAPAEQRGETVVKEIGARIDKVRGAHAAARKDIERRFPSYAELTDPKPASVDDVRAVLKTDEAFLAFYFGGQASFVWAIPKTGAVAFAMLPLPGPAIEAKVKALREGFDTRGDGADDVAPFDLALAHELYRNLLQPVEAAWLSARTLLVVTNGSLGLLPLGVLPTKLAQAGRDAETGPAFARYRSVAWLARTHAVSMLPSAAALRTLRQLPPGSDKREALIGFGDPYFSVEQALAAERPKADALLQVAVASERGLPVKRRTLPQTLTLDSADLALLPRLPDTADELKAVALALHADPAKVLHLGREANEARVKGTDLSRYRILAFATHGLTPGEINGLTEPALALTAPEVANVEGDGLLTMAEVLALKLDADWVVLSACNTGLGAAAGAEAISGLGRAFFYAGTRTLLVTNWAVDSLSARELVTDTFRRQAADAGLSRAEALRQASITLMDGPGFTNPAGDTLFTYAHPLFWAPYTIVGDGG